MTSQPGLDFAIKVVESQYQEVAARYDTLNQKLGTYSAALAIISTIIVLFLQNVLSQGANSLGLIARIANTPVPLVLLFFLMLASLTAAIGSIALALVRVFQGLIPLKLQHVDTESFEMALQDRVASAKKRYALDLAAATRWNSEKVRNRFSLLYSIDACFKTMVTAMLLLIVSYALLLIFN